jgi:hypothetical protein
MNRSGVTIHGFEYMHPVLRHMFRSIPNRSTQIQGFPRLRAYSAATREYRLADSGWKNIKTKITKAVLFVEWHYSEAW